MKIEVCSLDEAKKRLRSKQYTGSISIGDIGEPSPSFSFHKNCKLLRLEFDDVCWSSHITEKDRLPNQNDIQKIIDFAKTFKGNDEILIHCHHGISRSSAAGFILNCVWMGPYQEEEALSLTLDSCHSHWVFPNDIMVGHADDLLDRKGRMINCLHMYNPAAGKI